MKTEASLWSISLVGFGAGRGAGASTLAFQSAFYVRVLAPTMHCAQLRSRARTPASAEANQ